MSLSDALGAEALDAAKAIGLVDDGGNLQPDWFQSPLAALQAMLTTPGQRAAVLRLLDALAPAQPVTNTTTNKT